MRKESRFENVSILVIDDEMMLTEALALDFERRGCEVFQATDIEEAFRIVSAHSIDVVLSDVRLPTGSGIDLLERIKKVNQKRPQVVFLTGFSDLTRDDAIQKGAYELLEKPIDREKMFSTVAEAAVLAKK